MGVVDMQQFAYFFYISITNVALHSLYDFSLSAHLMMSENRGVRVRRLDEMALQPCSYLRFAK